jgi:hypothetical protein
MHFFENSTWNMLLWIGGALCVLGPLLRLIVIEIGKFKSSSDAALSAKKQMKKMQRDETLREIEAGVEARRQERAEAMRKFEEAKGPKKKPGLD